jgi:indoleacetamide hydrolase
MTDRQPDELHELRLAAAARAIRRGEVSSVANVGKRLQRASAHADLNAFITIDEAAVLEAARQANRSLREGRIAPLLGVSTFAPADLTMPDGCILLTSTTQH